ncbi:hypothetical protein [Gloeobacter morelensis]|uniref:hypothetical protein n=1 Tax=Gloeobacter morelensis TaxID=2907343 RepID=UPI001E32640C|nr:hypothetical protein [Gloeobacter morelensis]UFP97289.1 hypothetical protein ISF26_24525 [Gloeobacter morelensis MG652769]
MTPPDDAHPDGPEHKPKARCGLGFSCALMMQQPGLLPGDCENYQACGAALDYPMGASFDLQRIGADGHRTPWRIDRTGAAVAMLLQRGAPQTLEDFGLPALLDDLGQAVATLHQALAQVQGYIAPRGAVVVSERRGGRTRLRLVATGRPFLGARGSGRVRVIHLGDEQDERTRVARAGIERRNRLDDAHRLATAAWTALQNAATLMGAPLDRALCDQVGDDVGDGTLIAGGDGRPFRNGYDLARTHPGGGDDASDDDEDEDQVLVLVDPGDGGESVLMTRGGHQRAATARLDRRLDRVQATARDLALALERFAPPGVYVAPPACEAHRYNVKRPGRDGQGNAIVRTFWYNKLTSRQPIFAPAQEPHPVKVIHLSKDDDPRNLEARRGIERRNRLRRLATRLSTARAALLQAQGIVDSLVTS